MIDISPRNGGSHITFRFNFLIVYLETFIALLVGIIAVYALASLAGITSVGFFIFEFYLFFFLFIATALYERWKISGVRKKLLNELGTLFGSGQDE